MRKNLTFLILWLSLICAAQNNSGVIKVNVEDGCGNTFTQPVTIDLYQKISNVFTKIATKNVHPAQFNDLETGGTYEIRMSSSDVSETDMSIKDVHALRQTILGHFPYTIQANFVGDLNGNDVISTFDMVYMQRNMIKTLGNIYNQWMFFDQTNLNINSFNVELLNKTLVSGIPNGVKEVTFNGYKQGAVASAIPAYCAACPEDSLSKTAILIPDIDVQAGKEVEFSVQFSSNNSDVGLVFSLKYLDAVISNVSPSSGSSYNHVDSISSIHMIAYTDQGWASNYHELAKIKFTPSRSGKLTSFFALNDQFKKEFVYKDGNCLKTYQNVTLNTTSPCPVTWPADTTIPDCVADYNAGSPVIDPACILFVTVAYHDQVFGNPCNKILRTWTAINWQTMEIFTHIQVITIDGNYSTICQDVTLVVTDSLVIYANDLIKNNVNGHVYSFSAIDPNQTTMTVKYELPYVVDLTVYDLTANRFCISRVTKVNTGCNEPVKVIGEISLEGTNGFFLANGMLFDGGNEDHCVGTISDFQIRLLPSGNFASQLIFNYDQYKGTNIMVALRYKIDGNWVNHGMVKIVFVNDSALPPFELTCFDDPVTKNELFEIAFFSPTFDNILALQGAIRVKDAIVVSTRKIKLSDIVFNEELRSLKYLWLLPTVTSQSFGERDTLFTMTILPTVNGNLSDILSTAEDLLNSEAILNDFGQTKIDLVFKFLRRSSATHDLVQKDITLYPNPSSNGDFIIQTNDYDKANIRVFNEKGQMVYTSQQSAVDGFMQVSMPEDSKNGVYFVRVDSEQYSSIKKLIILK
ncbi:MAG: T9SS type A sorting domain-containing protein [Saprospiraceae bacterium]|nr:T9SS type A sorting domain-containing protein [Saprospiraceae bacterium]MBP6566892.1 T9SS type A sorting domain-containing protein [Saprospiraceae bacterium]